MPNKIVTSTLFAAAIIFAAAAVPPARANRFSSQDSDMLSAITKRFEIARGDSLDASRALLNTRNLDAGDCLSSILDAANAADEIMDSISTLTSVRLKRE
jgi:hypothetical protein